MDSKKQARKRITLVLRVELIDRVLEKARLLQQGPNNFVSLCVKGVLEAMDDPETGYDIPILTFLQSDQRKSLSHDQGGNDLLGALVPEVRDIDAQEQKFLIDLVKRHEGNLTLEVFTGYRKLAHRLNTERAAHERELKKLQSKT